MFASKFGRLALVLLAVALALPVAAADKKADPAKEQVRRLQQVQRKLEQENEQLTQDKIGLESRLKEIEGKLEVQQRQAAAVARKLAAVEKELAATVVAAAAEKKALGERLLAAEQQFARLTELQRTTDSERQRLDALAAQQKLTIASCEGHNASLHSQGVALLDRYQRKTCLEATLQREPFTGMKQVEIENFVEANRDRLDAERIEAQSRR